MGCYTKNATEKQKGGRLIEVCGGALDNSH